MAYVLLHPRSMTRGKSAGGLRHTTIQKTDKFLTTSDDVERFNDD
jgi:hypothetical protein